MTTDPNVRYDIGGWISGPMLSEPLPPVAPVRMVPPNSTALRELAHAIAGALTLPAPATQRDEVTYLRISRDRARLVLYACKRIAADHEAEDEDIMNEVHNLRQDAADLGDDAYDHNPLES